MTKAQFEALMPIMVSDLAGMIARERSIPEEEAVMLLYRSRTSRTRRRRCGITARRCFTRCLTRSCAPGR